jgi:hypothetical protein
MRCAVSPHRRCVTRTTVTLVGAARRKALTQGCRHG